MSFREQTGGFTLLRVDKSEPRRLEVTVKEREGSHFAKLTLQLREGEAVVVEQLRLNVVPRPADQPAQPRLAFEEALKAVDKQAAELALGDKFSGALLVARGDGTGDIFMPEFEKHRLDLRTLDDYLKLYGARGLAFEPGSKWEYSNYVGAGKRTGGEACHRLYAARRSMDQQCRNAAMAGDVGGRRVFHRGLANQDPPAATRLADFPDERMWTNECDRTNVTGERMRFRD